MQSVNRLLNGILVVVFIIMMLAVTLQVFFRYVLNNPLSGSEEIARLTLVWVTFVGSAVAVRDNTHLKIDFLVERLSAGWRLLALSLTDVATLVFSVLLVVIGTRLAEFSWVFESAALRFPMTYFHAALPVSAALMAAYSAVNLGRRLHNWWRAE